ncbi:MAG: type II toxin-antitoxin system mRNA interferase toxin, RelE/StbE family [Desulfobacteraceae bacterium]
MNQVFLNKKARKQLKNLPKHIIANLRAWINEVETVGINETRKVKGYHDEPLKGNRSGQRSVRLSKAYRAFYIERDDRIVIEVIEVNKHDY